MRSNKAIVTTNLLSGQKLGNITITGAFNKNISLLMLQYSNLTDTILSVEKMMPENRKFGVKFNDRDYTISVAFLSYPTKSNHIAIDFIYDIVDANNAFNETDIPRAEIISAYLFPESEIVKRAHTFISTVGQRLQDSFDQIKADCQPGTCPIYIFRTNKAVAAATH